MKEATTGKATSTMNFYTPKMKQQDRLRRHKMITQAEVKAAPAIGTTDGQPSKTAFAKWFAGSATWYGIELDPETGEVFGYVNLSGHQDDPNAELGYFSLTELGEVGTTALNLPVERDLYFDGIIPGLDN